MYGSMLFPPSALLLLLVVVCTATLAHGGGGTYTNPVISGNSPDPGALLAEDGSTIIVVTTSNMNDEKSAKFPIHQSTDGGATWQFVRYAFPENCSSDCPQWGKQDFWAPEIHRVNNVYNLYYTARGEDGALAIGVATSNSGPFGPFVDNKVPLVHNSTMGNIDATFFQDGDDGTYLVWKEDGNAAGLPTPIYQQKLAKDGLSLAPGYQRHILITDDQPWEENLVEGPWIIQHNASYYLFYSGSWYATTRYAVGVARASHVEGPYVKMTAGPILHSSPAFSGPGHCSVLKLKDGRYMMLYHSWDGDKIGGNYPRSMLLDEVKFSRVLDGGDDHDDGEWPVMGNGGMPSSTQMPLP